MTSETPNLDYLKEQVDRLQQLLNDPHPGLVTWQQAYADRVNAIVKFWADEAIEKLAIQKFGKR